MAGAGGRPPGSRNKDLASFHAAFKRAARRRQLNVYDAIAELCQDSDKGVRLQALKLAVLMMHAKPLPLGLPIASAVQLSFLPAEPPPPGDTYEGEVIEPTSH